MSSKYTKFNEMDDSVITPKKNSHHFEIEMMDSFRIITEQKSQYSPLLKSNDEILKEFKKRKYSANETVVKINEISKYSKFKDELENFVKKPEVAKKKAKES